MSNTDYIGQNFVIKIINSYRLEYIEGNRAMEIEIDFREPVPDFFLDDVKQWKSPYDQEKISQKKQVEIFENIAEYLKKNGYKQIYVHDYGYI